MTKTELCQMIVDNYEMLTGFEVEESEAFRSTALGIAMEHLGMIKSEEIKNYLAKRGGLINLANVSLVPIRRDRTYTAFSFRDLLALLPD